ncbi:MAG: hypothetical protein WKF59_16755 [Chitinophagaceae bacterium]
MIKRLESVTNSPTNYGGGTTTGIFYLDAPAYAHTKFNILYIFCPRDSPSIRYGVAMVERIPAAAIQQIPNKNLLKKIPNE